MRTFYLCVLVYASIGATAHADSKADEAARRAKRLLAERKYAEACAAFEEADKLDPGIGIKLNIGKCYEEWGKLATAYRWYDDAASAATTAGDKRAKKIRDQLEALDGDVPRLTVNLPAGVDARTVTVKLDGDKFASFGVEARVDPGRHTLTVEVDGQVKTKEVPALEKGSSVEVTLEVPPSKPKPKPVDPQPKPDDPISKPPPPPPPAGDHPSSGGGRRLAGIALGAAGAIALGVAGGVTLRARSKYNDALATHCMGAKNMCDDEGIRVTSDARSQANFATGIAIGGGLAVAGGIVLFVTAPRGEKKPVTAVPIVTPGGGGVAVRLRF